MSQHLVDHHTAFSETRSNASVFRIVDDVIMHIASVFQVASEVYCVNCKAYVEEEERMRF